MDSLVAIAAGIVLRVVLATNRRVSTTLIGLWEGIVVQHLVQTMPRGSPDPYIGWAVRLLVDYLITEDLKRVIMVVVWSGMG
ncbi:hypothetical protein CYLTODRAFT_326945, partial [Cylindrobasidium torrendii FP15055 ss-10]